MPGSLRLEPVRIFSLETPYSTPFRRDRRSMRLGKTMAIAYIHTNSAYDAMKLESRLPICQHTHLAPKLMEPPSSSHNSISQAATPIAGPLMKPTK